MSFWEFLPRVLNAEMATSARQMSFSQLAQGGMDYFPAENGVTPIMG